MNKREEYVYMDKINFSSYGPRDAVLIPNSSGRVTLAYIRKALIVPFQCKFCNIQSQNKMNNHTKILFIHKQSILRNNQLN